MLPYILCQFDTSYPCDFSSKIIAKNHNAVCCDKCDMRIYIVCNNLSKYYYRKLQKDKYPKLYANCLRKEMAFSNLSENQLKNFMSWKTIISPSLVEENQTDLIIPQEFGAAIKNKLYTPQGINDL